MDEPEQPPSLGELLLAVRALRGRLSRLEEAVYDLQRRVAAPEPPALPLQAPPRAAEYPQPSSPQAAPGDEPVILTPAEEAPVETAIPAAPAAPEPGVPPAAAEPVTAVVTPAAEPPKPAQSLEQVLGTRWMLFVGVGVLLVGGVFFFKYAIERGWISPTIRVLTGAAVGLLMIAFGEWALLRRKLRLFAAGIMGGGVVLLYFVAFVASPNGWYRLIGTVPAFVLMCLVTAVAVGLSLQTRMLSTSVVALIGAFATPALLSTGENRQTFLMCYVLLVNAGFLGVALWKAWGALGPLALAGTVAIFAGWFYQHFEAAAWPQTTRFGWLLFAEFLAYVCLGSALERLKAVWGKVVLIAAGSAATVLWLFMIEAMPAAWFFAGLLALVVVLEAVGLWRDWDSLSAGALGWSAVGVFCQIIYLHHEKMALADRWLLSNWTWVLFAAVSAPVLLRAFWKRRAMNEFLHAALSSLALAGMFGATYGLLRGEYPTWMGPYAAGVGAAAVGLSVVVWLAAKRRVLGYFFLGQGLVLLTLAVPIHFDHASVPLAWAVQGVVVMFLARRLRNLLLLITPPIVLALAVVHFFASSLPNDPAMRETAFVLLGTDVTFGLLLAAALAAALLIAAAILRFGEAMFEEQSERLLAMAMVAAAFGVLAVRTAVELPTPGATWCWLVLAAFLAVVGLWRRSDWLSVLAGIALLLAAVKWVGFDTLGLRAVYGPDTRPGPLANWQCAAGLAVAVLLAVHARLLRARITLPWHESFTTVVVTTAGVLAALLVVYAGSFEIDRFFESGRMAWDDPFQAKQTAWSVWWAVYAAALMVLGFVRSRRSPRYLAMGLFAVTLGKVFLVDMAKVETVYRVLSFLCLGTLLVAASWLYHRYFREKLQG